VRLEEVDKGKNDAALVALGVVSSSRQCWRAHESSRERCRVCRLFADRVGVAGTPVRRNRNLSRWMRPVGV